MLTLVMPRAAGAPMERETGFEPATPSLEGWRSTAELFPPARSARFPAPARNWWGEEDLNPRRRAPADLQSAPFGHLGISPLVPRNGNSPEMLALAGGFEPPTHCLQGSCSSPELRQQSQNFTLVSRI